MTPSPPESLPITHTNLLPLRNPSLPLPTLPLSHHKHSNPPLPPSLPDPDPAIPKFRIRPISDPPVIVHKPRLIPLPRRIHTQPRPAAANIPLQAQVVVGLGIRIPDRVRVHAAQVVQDEGSRRQMARCEEPALPVRRVRGVRDPLYPDERTRLGELGVGGFGQGGGGARGRVEELEEGAGHVGRAGRLG